MINDVKNRLNELISAKKLSINALAALIGIPQTTLNQALKSERKVSVDVIALILDTFQDVSAEWLMRGKGDMFASSDDGSIVINNSNVSQHGNGNAIGNGNTTGASSTDILAIIQEKDQVIAAKDARITELTDHIIRLTLK